MDPGEDIQTSKTVDLDNSPARTLHVRLPVMPFRPGNAWAQLQLKEQEKQLQASTGSKDVNSFLQRSHHFNHPSTTSEDTKGTISHKSTSPTTTTTTATGLDLNEELAVPMPKLKLIRSSPSASADERSGKVERSVTIPNFLPSKKGDAKATEKKPTEKSKKSKVATILKNKFSLKDIARESKKNIRVTTRQEAAKTKELPAIVSKESIHSFAEPKMYVPKPKDSELHDTSSAPQSAILGTDHDFSGAPEIPSARHTRSAPILSTTPWRNEAGESKNEYSNQTSVDDCIATTKYSNTILASEKGEADATCPLPVSPSQNNENALSIPNTGELNSPVTVTERQVERGQHSKSSIKANEKGHSRGIRGDVAEKSFPGRRNSTASARQIACWPPVHGATGIGTWDHSPAVFRPEEDVGRQPFNGKRKNRHQIGVAGEGEPGPTIVRSQNPSLAPLAPSFRPNPSGSREGQYDLSMSQVDEGPFLGGTTRHGGYAPPPPHPSYQNTLTLEQQLTSHTNSVHHHLNGAVDRITKVFGDSHNWLTDQILRSTENLQDSARVICSRAVAQSEMADELKGLMAELRSDLVALRMDMQSMDRRYTDQLSHEHIALHKKLDAITKIKLVTVADEGCVHDIQGCNAAKHPPRHPENESHIKGTDLGVSWKTTVSPTENTGLNLVAPRSLDTEKRRPSGGFTTPCTSHENVNEDGAAANEGCQANAIHVFHESVSSLPGSGGNGVSLSVPSTPTRVTPSSNAVESFEQRKHEPVSPTRKRGVFGWGKRRRGNNDGKNKTPSLRSFGSGLGNSTSPDQQSSPLTEYFQSPPAHMNFTPPNCTGDSSEINTASIHAPVFKPQQRQQGGYQRHQSHPSSSPVSYHRQQQQQHRAGYGNGPFPQLGNSLPNMCVGNQLPLMPPIGAPASVYPQPQTHLSRGHGPNPVLPVPGASAAVQAPAAYGITPSRNWRGERE